MKSDFINVSLICFISLFFSCKKTSFLEEALLQSNDNRIELEKVLNHYEADSLKLEAARFLIENMPYHYSYEGEELEKYLKYFECLSLSWMGSAFVKDSLEKANGGFNFGSLRKVPDITTIDSAYLVRNINFAFKVWQEQPWGKNVSFENFREYILPYRIGDEVLTDWREEIYNRYNPMLDSIRGLPEGEDPLIVAQVLMDSLSKYPVHFTGIFPQGPHVGPKLVEWRSGSCLELTDLVTYVFRAVGLPGGCDKMLMRGNSNVGHFWNFIIGKNDTTLYGSIGHSSKELKDPTTFWDPKGKVYRETFSLNREMIAEQGNNPLNAYPTFGLPLLRDVTATYAGEINRFLRFGTKQLTSRPKRGEAVYLCTSSRMNWVPIGYGVYKKDSVRIDNVQGALVFRLATYRNGQLDFLTEPFLLEKYTGETLFFTPQAETEEVKLLQKFKEDFQAHMVGGVFEASNDLDFREKDTLYMIQERPPRLFNVVQIPPEKEYRYIRYYGPENRNCNVSEIAFYSAFTDTEPLKGEIISPPGVPAGNIVNQFKNVFDGDPYTSLDYRERSGGWVGLDLGTPQSIGKIVYTPRNRDNFIRTGDRYELFYCAKGDWTSAGTQVATSDSLLFDVPKGSLLYLRNYTRGVDERIFEYKEGKQHFW